MNRMFVFALGAVALAFVAGSVMMGGSSANVADAGAPNRALAYEMAVQG